MRRSATPLLSAAAAAVLGFACAHATARPPVLPPGGAKSAETELLQAGATELQGHAPIGQINVYLDAFHTMKDEPGLVLEAHHYCAARNEEFMQCVLFDGNGADANLVGVEYIVSERLFDGLPDDEKRLWHPHDYEILSGQLIAPGIPEAAEHELLKKKMNSYGKTWHFWDTGHFRRLHGDALPVGSPMLAWSFNADGEVPPQLVTERDRRVGVDTSERRGHRADLRPLAHPQEGVNDLARFFPDRRVPEFVKAK